MMKQQNFELDRLPPEPQANPPGNDGGQEPVSGAATTPDAGQEAKPKQKRKHKGTTGVKGRGNRIIDPEADRRTPAIRKGWLPREHRIGHTLSYLSAEEARQVQSQQSDPDFEGPLLPLWMHDAPIGNAYTPETKLAVFRLIAAGKTAEQIAAEFNVSVGGVNGWRNEASRQGLLPPREGTGRVTNGWGVYTGEVPRSDHSYQGLPKRPTYVPGEAMREVAQPVGQAASRSEPEVHKADVETVPSQVAPMAVPGRVSGFGSISVRIVGDRKSGEVREIASVDLNGSEPGLPAVIRTAMLKLCSMQGDGREPFHFVHDGLGGENVVEGWFQLAVEVALKGTRPVSVVYPAGSVNLSAGMP